MASPEGGQGRRFSGGRHGEKHNSHRIGWPADVGVGGPSPWESRPWWGAWRALWC